MVDCKRVFIVTQHHNFKLLILGVYDSIEKARDRELKEKNYHLGEIGFEFYIDVYEVF